MSIKNLENQNTFKRDQDEETIYYLPNIRCSSLSPFNVSNTITGQEIPLLWTDDTTTIQVPLEFANARKGLLSVVNVVPNTVISITNGTARTFRIQFSLLDVTHPWSPLFHLSLRGAQDDNGFLIQESEHLNYNVSTLSDGGQTISIVVYNSTAAPVDGDIWYFGFQFL